MTPETAPPPLTDAERDELDQIIAAALLPTFTPRERDIARTVARMAFKAARDKARQSFAALTQQHEGSQTGYDMAMTDLLKVAKVLDGVKPHLGGDRLADSVQTLVERCAALTREKETLQVKLAQAEQERDALRLRIRTVDEQFEEWRVDKTKRIAEFDGLDIVKERRRVESAEAEVQRLTGEHETLASILNSHGGPRDGLLLIDRATALVIARQEAEKAADAYRLELEALTVALESLKGEHERLTAERDVANTRYTNVADRIAILQRDRAAIERQVITETIDKVLSEIDTHENNLLDPDEGCKIDQLRRRLESLRPHP